jgi:hypothetical protein
VEKLLEPETENAVCVCAFFSQDHPFLATMLSNPMLNKGAAATSDDQQQPTYVNPKQYNRIMARRKARAQLEAHRKIMAARKVRIHDRSSWEYGSTLH